MTLNNILENWSLSDQPVNKIYSSCWQIGDSYILKTGTDLQQLESNLRMIHLLAEQNIPVATVIPTTQGKAYIVEEGSYYFLSRKISGEHIADIYAGNYLENAYLIGTVVARLHIAFLECQKKITCYDNNFYEEMNGWVRLTFEEHGIESVPRPILSECINQLGNFYPRLPRQLIHRDIHPGNMLFHNNQLTGYIDFDLSQINARIFDLCYISLSFLVGRTDDGAVTAKWFEILKKLVEGYQTLIPLMENEKNAIPVMMIAIELLFIAYFTKEKQTNFAEGSVQLLLWLQEHKKDIHIQ